MNEVDTSNKDEYNTMNELIQTIKTGVTQRTNWYKQEKTGVTQWTNKYKQKRRV